MSLAIQYLGALIATYFASRVMLALLQGWRVRPWLRISTAHLIAWLGIAVCVGYLKAYIGNFSFSAGLLYVLPQLFWLVIDIFRRTRVF